jgi:protein TonB
MLAYYASRPRVAASRQSPNAMLAIIVGHVALVAVVMSAKMELPPRVFDPPIKIDLIHDDDPPPPADIRPEIPAPPRSSTLDRPPPQVPTPPVGAQTVDSNPALPNFDDLVGPRNDPPRTDPTPTLPVRVDARLLTAASDLKPPYPPSKLASEEEAVLRLRLTIDERGRVVAVEPVGRADRAFLDSARRHLIAHWRYRPATEDGRAVSSSAVITLRFQLDG